MRILIGRVGSFLLAVFLSAWSLTLGALDWLGRIMLMHDYDQALQRLPQWAGWLFSTPWWVPAILASVLTCFLIWLSWPRTQAVMPAIAAATANPPLREVPSASLAATHLQSKRILSDAIVVDGDEDRLPEFRGRFAENGRGATFYIEYSFAFGGIGSSGQWAAPRRLLAFSQARFSRGEEIDFPLVSRCEVDGLARWRFGPPKSDGNSDQPRDLLNAKTNLKGRVTLLASDDREQHCYFIARTDDNGTPKVLGKHMFNHILEWEGRDLSTGDAESLFR